jgi:DtxR family transcriptional regulator, Mn-dependent transcriptional regulator
MIIMHNVPTEDYIKAVYRLEREGEKVTTSALAEQLQLADASITDMIKKLSEKGLIHYEPYRGVGLTARGKRAALKIVRRHRLWEMYLVRFLGFSWDQVHDEAERLEHATSDEMEQRLDSALGFPMTDPHGDPIPDAKGELAPPEYTALSEYSVGDVVKVLRVSDDDSQMLQHAAKMGLKLNKKLIVKEKRTFDGSMVVKVGMKEQFISQQMAHSIFVRPA